VVKALADGGVTVAEITMTVPGALDVVKQVRASLGDRVLLGAGTILDPETARAAFLAFATLATAQIHEGQITSTQGSLSIDLTPEFRRWLGLLDEDALYLELLAWKRTQGWWNFAFDRGAIGTALASDRYQILGLPGLMALSSLADLERLQRLAATLVRRLLEGLYRRRENQRSRFS